MCEHLSQRGPLILKNAPLVGNNNSQHKSKGTLVAGSSPVIPADQPQCLYSLLLNKRGTYKVHCANSCPFRRELDELLWSEEGISHSDTPRTCRHHKTFFCSLNPVVPRLVRTYFWSLSKLRVPGSKVRASGQTLAGKVAKYPSYLIGFWCQKTV